MYEIAVITFNSSIKDNVSKMYQRTIIQVNKALFQLFLGKPFSDKSHPNHPNIFSYPIDQ